MALQKQPISLNFSSGIDTKSDPKQVQIGKFLSLQNSIFDTAGQLTKRNGFANLTTLPDADQTTLTTFNESLIATGSDLYSYNPDIKAWYDRGLIQPVQLNTTSLVRSATSQTAQDASVSTNGLVCMAYIDSIHGPSYQVSDSVSGSTVVLRTALPATAHSMRVFALANFFVITFIATITGAPHLAYIAIPINNPTNPSAVTNISGDVKALTSGYDGFYYLGADSIYFTWEGGSNNINVAYMTSTLVVPFVNSVFTRAGASWDIMGIAVSAVGSPVWLAAWDSNVTSIRNIALPLDLSHVLAASNHGQTLVDRITLVVNNNSLATVFVETHVSYSGAVVPTAYTTHFLNRYNADLTGGITTVAIGVLRSVGLASKAFFYNANIYLLVSYGETPNQPSYFLMRTQDGVAPLESVMRLAYANGEGYLTTQVLPEMTLQDGIFNLSYLVADFLTFTNKGTNNPSGTPVNALYTQTGINLARFTINSTGQQSSNIANNLYLSGGMLWQYDGVQPVEQGFNVWPELIPTSPTNTLSTITTGGSIAADTYFYVFTYEWTDNQGNINRSAPSIPIEIITSGATSTNTVYVPTCRITYKLSNNPIYLVGYRWSTSQPIYYQFTSVTSPIINDITIDYIAVTDTNSNDAILGNTILYTTGGVVENIGAPATSLTVLFGNRLFLVDSEDQNLLWYSKQVIENTPVDMSDLFTIYVAPTTGTQGSTGPITALGAMDDKLIAFKKDAIYYINGSGPDNTGANNDFSSAIFITASVGCSNPNSIALTPAGLMFQSDKGIWLLGRDLSTSYIGAPVEAFNGQVIKSANVIPGTNQVRFIVDNSMTLVYDYYFQQWGTFTNINAISSTLFNSQQTYLNQFGQVLQESLGSYLDGSRPVLMSFTSAWISFAGLQGYERFYFMYLLGTYYTPFKLDMRLAYDYNQSASQNILVTPDNFSAAWGGEALWGSGGGWGGQSNVFECRLFPQKQKCETFQVSMQEVYDSSLGVQAGKGLSLSGMNLVVGVKRGYRTQSAAKSFG